MILTTLKHKNFKYFYKSSNISIQIHYLAKVMLLDIYKILEIILILLVG